MLLMQQGLWYDPGPDMCLCVCLFLMVSASVGLVFYFQMLVYMILGQVSVSVCARTGEQSWPLWCWCHGWSLWGSGCPETISTSVFTILRHRSENGKFPIKGIYPAVLYMLWNSPPLEKMLVIVPEIHCSEKKEKLNHWEELPLWAAHTRTVI